MKGGNMEDRSRILAILKSLKERNRDGTEAIGRYKGWKFLGWMKYINTQNQEILEIPIRVYISISVAEYQRQREYLNAVRKERKIIFKSVTDNLLLHSNRNQKTMGDIFNGLRENICLQFYIHNERWKVIFRHTKTENLVPTSLHLRLKA